MWEKVEFEELFERFKQEGYVERKTIGCDINDFYSMFKFCDSLWLSVSEVGYSENRMPILVEKSEKILDSFKEQVKWVMLFLFVSDEQPLLLQEVKLLNNLAEYIAENITDGDLFWEVSHINNKRDEMKFCVVVGS